MSIVEWFGLAAICFLGAATPGPSLAVIATHSLKSGYAAGQLASFAHAFAILIYAIATILGLATLFDTYPILYKSISILGAAYLFYLAINLIKASQITEGSNNTLTSDLAQLYPTNSATSYLSAIKDAFMIAFLNPKLAIFFVALFSQFIPQGEVATSLVLVLCLTVFLIDLIWYLVVCYFLERSKSKIKMKEQHVRRFYLAQAIIFTIIAINTVINIL